MENLSKLQAIEYFNIGGMGADILNVWGFIKIKIRFIKIVMLIKFVYFVGEMIACH